MVNVEGVEIELDDDVTVDDLERYGADSRDDVEIDLEALEAAAQVTIPEGLEAGE